MAARTVVLAVNPDIMPELARLLAGSATISEPIGGEERMRVHVVDSSDLPVCIALVRTIPSTVDLPPRVLQTLQLLADGLPVKEVAVAMGIGLATAKTHAKRLYRLLGVRGAPEAVAVGYRTGLLTGGES